MKIKLLLSALLIGLLVGCSSSVQLTKSWSDPSLNADTKPFNKVLVIAQLKDDSMRRIAEEKIVASSLRGNFVQSYNYLKPSEQEEKIVIANLTKDGIDGVILMRLTDIEKTTSYVQGSTYGWEYQGGYYGEYEYGYGFPGYYQENKTYYVETNIYDVKTNKLLWAGLISTTNPSKLDTTLDAIITTVKTELNNKGLIKKEEEVTKK
ncbi:hypothetical protein FNW25_01650 [Flavobacterium franklandianum]|uniref:hypothetical protein n=1 Tax=Flavobacterium franklandianum TaxID=2594430 RepID=UPI00117A1D11|nr:hypothetical protein [Flavobacterium franklandianum]TRX29688.1 hypothetical protein FNW25_01650 [Flavobacterium franklandianum]